MAHKDLPQANEEVPVSVTVTLKEYLDKLQGLEASKLPSQRRDVPTLPELAEAAGVTRQTIYNLAGGNVKLLNLETLSSLLNEFRRRGFRAEIGDLLTAYPAEETKGKVPA